MTEIIIIMTDTIKSDNTAVCANLAKAIREKFPDIRRLTVTFYKGFGIYYEDKRFPFSTVYRVARDFIIEEGKK